MIGALLHDIGKGYPGDHTEAGMAIVRQLAPRLGFGPGEVDTLVAMVEHHLLLPDFALRRDITDKATIEKVAEAVETVERLELLHALTDADSRATGPAAWGSWQAELVNELVDPGSSRARRRRCHRGDVAAVPRCRDARSNGGGDGRCPTRR